MWLCFGVALSGFACANTYADDIDVYKARFSAQNKPNILFLLDYSGSMKDDVYGNNPTVSGLSSKLDILKEAMVRVLEENQDRLSVGIGSIYSDDPSGVRWPISELNADANTVDPDIPAGSFLVKDILVKELDRFGAGGATATVAALAEAAMYFKGGSVLHNDRNPLFTRLHRPDSWNTGSNSYSGGYSRAASKNSYLPRDAYVTNVNEPGNYNTCTDYSATGGANNCAGLATYNCWTVTGGTYVNAEGESRTTNPHEACRYPYPDAWRGATYVSPITQSCQQHAIVLISDGQPTRTVDDTALLTAAGSSHSDCEDLSVSVFGAGPGGETRGNCGTEIVRNLANNDQVAGIPESTVSTYTVGFGVDGPGKNYLELLAAEGGGSFFSANEADQLSDALLEAMEEIAGSSESFTPFAIDINKATFSHDNRVFLNMFKPSSREGWTGNLKGFFIGPDGLTDTLDQPATVVKDGVLRFSDASQSFWSSMADGNDVDKGGASEKVQTQPVRSLYTYPFDTAPAGVNLASSAVYQLNASNADIDDALMGLSSGSALRAQSLDWLQTAPMGDPLHTISRSVQYAGRTVVYSMTNQGLLHAIDATSPTDPSAMDHSGGNELFAFMPRRLLSNLPKLFAETSGGDHIYGLDGGLTPWHTDTNGDGIANNGEKVLLFFGMRRGGDAYYAMDVSNPLQPKLMWKIDSSTPGFASLAQSWSRASLVTVNDAGTPKPMLVFGGGYDAAVVDGAVAPTPSNGNAIYMVDQLGALRWSVQQSDNAELKYSIASDLTIIDSDSDGVSDRIYVGDVGGQVWRIDYDDINDSPSVKRFADFSADGFHPFFYAPSVALNKQDGDEFLSITLGSGNRTDPLYALSQNSLFMMRDSDVAAGVPTTGSPTIDKSSLYNAKDNNIGSDDDSIAQAARDLLKASRGWVLDFAQGEKALAKILTFEDTILLTTYQALPNSSDPCANHSVARLYTLNLKTAQPVKFLDDGSLSDEQLTAEDRSVTLENAGIPSSPKVVFRADSSATDIYVDREKVSVIDGRLRVIYWHAK